MKEVAATDKAGPLMLPLAVLAGRFAAGRDVAFHSHPGAELVFITEGVCRCSTSGGTDISGSKGTMLVLPPDLQHDQRNAGFTRTTYVVFSAPPGQFDVSARAIPVPDGDPLRDWMEHLCDYLINREPEDDTVSGALLLACLERLKLLEHGKSGRDRLHPALARAVAYIEANAASPFQADRLAQKSGLSVSHMNTLFRQQLGCSPLQYLHSQRLLRARRLLLGPYSRVNETALACGFEDTNYFVRLFTRKFGVPPGTWRKQQIRQAQRK